MNQSKHLFKNLAPYFLYLFLSIVLWSIIPSFSTRIENDSHAYLYFLNAFEKTGSFYPSTLPTLHTWFGIGYPLFMVFCTQLFNSLESIIVVQILLGLLTIFFIQKTAKHFTDAQGTQWATLLAATNIGFIIYPHFLLTESLMLFFVALLLFLATKTNIHLWLQLGLIGFLGSCTFLIKPALLYLLPFWGLFLLHQKAKEYSWTYQLGLFAFFTCCIALIPIKMMLYSKERFGHYYYKSVDKVNLYFFYLPHLRSEIESRPFLEIQKELSQKYPVNDYADPEAFDEVDALLKKEIYAHPFLAIKVWSIQMLKTLCGLYTNHLKLLLFPYIKGGDCSFFKFKGSFFQRLFTYLFYGDAPWWLALLGIFEIGLRTIAIIIGIGTALYIFLKKEWRLFWLLVFPCAYFWAITGADGCGRLRLLMEPFWIILIVIGIKNIENYYKRP